MASESPADHFQTVRRPHRSPILPMPVPATIPQLRIAQVQAIRVYDHGPKGGIWVLPGLSHRHIIPTLWTILHQLEADWEDIAQGHVYAGDPADDLARFAFLHATLEMLESRYIQCLFSYINFFCLLENGFGVLYDKLKVVSHELKRRLKLPKKPKPTEYVQRVRRVRNHTVVHWGGPGLKHQLDSRAGRMWGFAWSTSATDLGGLEFGYMGVVGANPRVLKALGETHHLCVQYLQQLDAVCAELLGSIVAQMPITIGTREYEVLRPAGGAAA